MKVDSKTRLAEQMRLSDLIERLKGLEPSADDVYIARLALLLTKLTDDLSALEDDFALAKQCKTVKLKMDALHDQQAAIAQELSELAASSPCEFNPNHIWTLVRGIKIQSQILDCYLD